MIIFCIADYKIFRKCIGVVRFYVILEVENDKYNMNLSSEEYEKIIRNNATEISVLQDTIEKLTNELSVELGENILQTKRVLEHQKSLEETKKLYHHLWQYHQSLQNRSMIRNVQIDETIYILDEDRRFIYAND